MNIPLHPTCLNMHSDQPVKVTSATMRERSLTSQVQMQKLVHLCRSYLTAAEVYRHILQIEVTGQAKQESSKTVLLYAVKRLRDVNFS